MRNKFGFVLIRPQLGENIGACARSMKNFGFKKLILVTPKFSFPNHKTKVTSVGAYDVIVKGSNTNQTFKQESRNKFQNKPDKIQDKNEPKEKKTAVEK